MNSIVNLFRSSIGRKFLMAITGLVLVGFAAGHLVGNLQIFGHPDHINGYAHFLQGLGPALWLVRLVLLACTVVHIWAAVTLTIESRLARGPEQYGVKKWLSATVASRYMRMTGVVVAAFIVYHIAHFTVGAVQKDTFKTQLPEWTLTENVRELGVPLAGKGEVVHDVYSMVFLGFSNPWVSLFYIIAVGLLTVHILHGADSMFQTFGLRNHKWGNYLRSVVMIFCLAYFLGNLAIPGAILAGLNKPAEGTAAAKIIASGSCGTCCPITTATK
ncbi:MAG: succinate dehydrogenase cytochrome b subunit [Nibricoccus sp.]